MFSPAFPFSLDTLVISGLSVATKAKLKSFSKTTMPSLQLLKVKYPIVF